MPEFYMIFARKINKVLEFNATFARKMPEFYIVCLKKLSGIFLGWVGCPLPPFARPRLIRLWLGPRPPTS